MFMNKDLLYLIPFYDLRHMRLMRKRDPKLVKIRNFCVKHYNEIIRKYKKNFPAKF
jgi:hypothetical protein